jgi:hypothetical protein
MPAGRNEVDYTDIRYDALTYKVDGVTLFYDRTQPNGIGKAAGTGIAVMLSNDDTVALTNDGACVEGDVIKIESDGFATVRRWGLAKLPKGDSGIGTATRGRKIVGATLAGARGYIRDVNTATAAELGLMRGEIINVADATAIVVDLG